jgi:hypothetical protein
MSESREWEKEYEFAKLLSDMRNGLQHMIEAFDSYLNFLSKVVLGEWDPTNIGWVQAEGSRGLYEKALQPENDDFGAMLQDLKAHNGKLTRDSYFYWIFKDRETVGRKKKH